LTSLTTEHIQLILNEIAMSIGNSLDLRKMLKESLSTYLRKLNCSAGGVFMLKTDAPGNSYYEPVITTPRSFHSTRMYRAILKYLSDHGADYESSDFQKHLPLNGCVEEHVYFHANELPDFGYIILIKNNEDFDSFITKSLKPLNVKLARACLSCLQKTEIEKINTRLNDILMSSEDLVWETDLDGKLTYVSDSSIELLGYDQHEMIGKQLLDFMTESESKRVAKIISRKKSNKEPIKDMENWIVTRDGRHICVLTNGVPIFYEGEVLGYRGVNKDITLWKDTNTQLLEEINQRRKAENHLKKINEKLEQSNKELKDLTYIASHDLREPLRQISAFTELIENSLRDKLNPDDRENLDFIIKNASRMQLMIMALRDYSLVISKRLKLVNIDLNNLIEKILNFELAGEIKTSRADILISKPLHHIKCDYKQIRQVIYNLLSNSIKYRKANAKPRITISSQLQGDGSVKVEIQDNGIGIKREELRGLFVLFKRLHCHASYERVSINLAISKRIIGKHGGNIGVTSTYGEGSTFWFTVPGIVAVKETVASKVNQ
jgi:two-component system sensor histidine kinase/response regulator